MDTVEIKLRKDVLIAQIKLGLHMTGLEPKKRVTRALSVEQLERRVTWLRRKFKQIQEA